MNTTRKLYKSCQSLTECHQMIEVLCNEISEKEQLINSLQQENNNLQSDNSSLRNQLDYQYSNLQSVILKQDELSSLEEKYKEQLNTKEKKIERIQNEYLEKIREIKIQQEQSIQDIRSIGTEASKDFKRRLNELQEENDELRLEFQNSKNIQVDLKMVNDALLKRITCIDEEQRILRQENTRQEFLIEKLKDDYFSLQVQKETQSSRLHFLETQNFELQENTKTLQDQNETYRKKIQKLKKNQYRNDTYLKNELNDQIEIISRKYVMLQEKYDQQNKQKQSIQLLDNYQLSPKISESNCSMLYSCEKNQMQDPQSSKKDILMQNLLNKFSSQKKENVNQLNIQNVR